MWFGSLLCGIPAQGLRPPLRSICSGLEYCKEYGGGVDELVNGSQIYPSCQALTTAHSGATRPHNLPPPKAVSFARGAAGECSMTNWLTSWTRPRRLRARLDRRSPGKETPAEMKPFILEQAVFVPKTSSVWPDTRPCYVGPEQGQQRSQELRWATGYVTGLVHPEWIHVLVQPFLGRCLWVVMDPGLRPKPQNPRRPLQLARWVACPWQGASTSSKSIERKPGSLRRTFQRQSRATDASKRDYSRSVCEVPVRRTTTRRVL